MPLTNRSGVHANQMTSAAPLSTFVVFGWLVCACACNTCLPLQPGNHTSVMSVDQTSNGCTLSKWVYVKFFTRLLSPLTASHLLISGRFCFSLMRRVLQPLPATTLYSLIGSSLAPATSCQL